MNDKKTGKRKDSRGYILNKYESQRKSDGRYIYTYNDPVKGKRVPVYANTLAELRLKEKEIQRDLLDGIETHNNMTMNDLYDKYINMKDDLKETTKVNYIYTYNHFVRDSYFGRMKVANIRYSDVKTFYQKIMQESGMQAATIENIHTQIHPALTLAVRDNLIRNNPSDNVLGELKKSKNWTKNKRIALTIPQQKAFMNHVKTHKVFAGWEPIITVLLGTGMRIGECLALTWDDLDFIEELIYVRRTLVYRPNQKGESLYWINTPKTKAGERTIPMLPEVREALLTEYEFQKAIGFCEDEIDGIYGFVFSSGEHTVYIPSCVNDALHRIQDDYNNEETEKAKEESREPILLPRFSCHSLRHTFITRLCENETNLRVIMDICGHKSFTTTAEIYADVTKEKKQETALKLAGKIVLY